MWVKVLPSDPTKEVYFKEIKDENSWMEIKRIVKGMPEVVKTQTLVDTFGYSLETAQPCVVMVINEDGQHAGLPINEKASKYYPNDYDVKIRGDAVLTGWSFVISEGEMGFDIWDMPLKWRILWEMETLLAKETIGVLVHGEFDEFLLQLVDPDVRKMYEEARDSFPSYNWME